MTLLAFALTVVLAVAAAGCGGDGGDSAAEGSTGPAGEAGECPLEDGSIDAFATHDRSGGAGPLGPAQVQWLELATELINAEGGIAGCEFNFTIEDEPALDFESGTRKYRAALASGEYDVFFALFDSALLKSINKLIGPAGKPLIIAGVGDQFPTTTDFNKCNFRASVSTLQENRAVAQFITDQGWSKVAILGPNYAFGQDSALAFKEYFAEINPDGGIAGEQFPSFGEKNFEPFVNAATANDPDAVVGAQYGPDILSIWKVWTSKGLEIPQFYLIDGGILAEVKSADEIPPNAYGYSRGPGGRPASERGAEVYDAWVEKHDSEPNPFIFDSDNGVQLMRALVEETGSTECDAWASAVDAGGFTFESSFSEEPVEVSPINHDADVGASIGPIVFDKEKGHAVYDPDNTVNTKLSDVVTDEELEAMTEG